jgi:hypothetical protein
MPLDLDECAHLMFGQEAPYTDRDVLIISNTMRNAVTLGVSQNRLDTIRPNLELFRDFGGAHAIVEVIDNRIDRHPRTARHRSAALHFGLDFDEFARKASNGGRTGRTAR